MEALYFTASGASEDTAVGDLPDLPLPVNYPHYGSLALLPLQSPTYDAQVVFPRKVHKSMIFICL